MSQAQQSFWRRRWKLVLNIITVLALIILIIAIHNQLVDTFSNLFKVKASMLLLIIPIEALNYHAQARMYQGLFSVVGNKLPYGFLYRASLELNFVNHVFPSGGAAGISYFSIRMKKGEELTAAKATLIHVIKLMLTFLSFEPLLVIALLSLSIVGRISELTIMVTTLLSTLLIVGTAGFAYVVGSQHRINRFFTAVTKGLNRIIQIIRPKHPETINISSAKQTFNDFHDNYKEIKKDYRQLIRPFWYAMLANLTEVMAIFVVYLAFDETVNIGAIIIAYAIANFAGLVSILPGGVGIYEALMTAVLATAGVPPAVSLPVTVMYRVVNTVLQVPLGYALYQQTIRRGKRPPVESHAT